MGNIPTVGLWHVQHFGPGGALRAHADGHSPSERQPRDAELRHARLPRDDHTRAYVELLSQFVTCPAESSLDVRVSDDLLGVHWPTGS